MNTINQKRRTTSKYIGLIVALILFIVLIGFSIKDNVFIRLSYSNIIHNHFTVNDSIYASSYAMTVGNVGGIPLLRLVKNSDGKGSSYMIFSDDIISLEKVSKNKNKLIGRYMGHEIQDIRFKDQVGKDNFYAIQVEPGILVKSNDGEYLNKNHHTPVNNNYYVIRGYIADKK